MYTLFVQLVNRTKTTSIQTPFLSNLVEVRRQIHANRVKADEKR
ncbi:hypothetical protein [Geomicrobium sp. JCM 19055]|nr:hypothetical protein [Geomicrobium sp. JCM 19055]